MSIISANQLAAYFRRIGYSGPTEPSLAVLSRLHQQHPSTMAFESLDPFLGRPVQLDAGAVHAKLVGARRGGYCHEHNLLFHDVLATLGFRVAALGARVVWFDPQRDAPLTHRLTLVDLPQGRFIADVGFGAQTPTAPLRLEPMLAQATPHGTYRIMQTSEKFSLEMRLTDRWATMYRFLLEPLPPLDFEIMNWYMSTHPNSRFTQNLIVARVVGERRVSLANRKLVIRAPDGSVDEPILRSAADLAQVLDEVMGLEIPITADALWARVTGANSAITPTPRWQR